MEHDSDQTPLSRFLAKNTIKPSEPLPLVHSTSAYQVKRIIAGGSVLPQECKVFEEDKLVYLFYGRPSYKRARASQISKYWELPSVLIFDHRHVTAKRVYPFDTGAFASKERYPDFINMMDMGDFEVTGHVDAPQRLIGAFFVDTSRYFRLRPRSEQDFLSRFDVGVMEEEIRALHELTVCYSGQIDDRRFSIEIQTDKPVELSEGSLLAVVFPEEYCDSEEYMEQLYKIGAEPLPYSTYSLKQELYYSEIYNIVFEFYRSKGWVR